MYYIKVDFFLNKFYDEKIHVSSRKRVLFVNKLHFRHRFETQDIETFCHDASRRLCQQDPSVVDLDDVPRRVLLYTIARIVEFRKGGRDFVDVFAQVVQAQILRDLDEFLGEPQQYLPQLPLLLVVQRDRVSFRQLFYFLLVEVGRASDRPDPCVSIQQIDRRVSLVLEHLVEAEDVFVVAVVAQVGVLDAPVRDGLLRLLQLLRTQHLVAVFLLELVQGAFEPFLEQVYQSDGVSGPGLELLPVLAEDNPERDVVHANPVREQTDPAGAPEQDLEVRGLAGVRDVNDPVAFFFEDSLLDSSEVRGVVGVAPVGFHHREWDAAFVPVAPHDFAALVLLQVASLVQLRDDVVHASLVERLAAFGQSNLQPVVDDLELFARDVADQMPSFGVVGVESLELDDARVRAFLELLVLVEALFRFFVEALQVRYRRRLDQIIRKLVLQVRYQHPELRPPVPHVIDPQHVVPQKLQQPADALAYYGRAQMPHVHLFRDVGSRKIDQNAQLLLDRGPNSVRKYRRQIAQTKSLTYEHVNETGSRDFQSFDQLVFRHVFHYLVRDVSRRDFSPKLLVNVGQLHRRVALIVAEFRVVSGQSDHHRGIGDVRAC
jgi:hypothetical protein